MGVLETIIRYQLTTPLLPRLQDHSSLEMLALLVHLVCMVTWMLRSILNILVIVTHSYNLLTTLLELQQEVNNLSLYLKPGKIL